MSSIMKLQRVLQGLPQVLHLGVLILRYLIILATISGSCASNTTVVSGTKLPSTNNSRVDVTLQALETKEIEEVITELAELYTDIPEKNTAAEIPHQGLTTQLSNTDIYETTQITSLSTTLVDVVIEAVLLPIETNSTPRPKSTQNPIIPQSTDVAEASSRTPQRSAQTTLNPIISSKASTLTPSISSKATTLTPSISRQATTLTPSISSKATTLTPSISSQTTTLTPSISSKTTTLLHAFTSETTTINPSITTSKITTSSPSFTSNATTLPPNSTSKTTTPTSIITTETTPNNTTSKTTTSAYVQTDERTTGGPYIISTGTTSNPSVSRKTTTFLNPLPETATKSNSYFRHSTERERLSSSVSRKSTGIAYSASTESSTISNIRESNSTSNVTTVSEHVKTLASITDTSDEDTGEHLRSTTVSWEDTSLVTFIYVEDESDRDELPFFLIIIASTVAISVTLTLIFFAAIVCFARKRRQRRNAKYYDYKKRWVKRAPRPKYEKVKLKQCFRHDREAAGSGWVFQDGADPSKQITLELRPRNTQSSPEGLSNNGNPNRLNFKATLPENYPLAGLSSPEVALDLDGDSTGSLRLSKSLDRADRSTSSEGDSGILALGEDVWSPTKGVPFHFISDDAVIEL